MTETKTRYIPYYPKKPKPGWVLAHNRVQHDATTAPGVNGFRAWWSDAPPENFVTCHCGWAPDAGPHYAHERDAPEMRTHRVLTAYCKACGLDTMHEDGRCLRCEAP
jgi:hypothetical protein